MQALMPHCPDYGIEPRHLQAVIEGCQMDLEQTRYLDFAGLQRYCHLVAGVVGEVAARIFGQTDPPPPPTRTSWAWPSSSPTSSATWAKTRCAGASTCRSASCSSST
jgi:phytoene/squalene synthetase